MATDSDGNPLPFKSVSYSHFSGDRYYVGVTKVTVTVTGFYNNVTTCTFAIEVRPFRKYVILSYYVMHQVMKK